MKKFFTNLLCAFIPSRKLRGKIRNKKRKPSDEYNIGKFSYFGIGFAAFNKKETRIGKYCSIGNNVTLGPGQHDMTLLTTSPIVYNQHFLGFPKLTNSDFFTALAHKRKTDPNHNQRPVNIGNDVWIGKNVIVMDGVTIGDGVIIGSGSIVTHDIPAFSVVAGVPAKFIRNRFSPEIISDLMEIKWWDLPDEFVANLPFHDINKSIQICKDYRQKNNI